MVGTCKELTRRRRRGGLVGELRTANRTPRPSTAWRRPWPGQLLSLGSTTCHPRRPQRPHPRLRTTHRRRLRPRHGRYGVARIGLTRARIFTAQGRQDSLGKRGPASPAGGGVCFIGPGECVDMSVAEEPDVPAQPNANGGQGRRTFGGLSSMSMIEGRRGGRRSAGNDRLRVRRQGRKLGDAVRVGDDRRVASLGQRWVDRHSVRRTAKHRRRSAKS